MHRAKSSTAAERFHRLLHSYGTIQNVLFIQNFEPARRLNFGTVQAVFKMRYILWVVALLEVCDITNNGRHLGRHLGFYQELEIKLKSR